MHIKKTLILASQSPRRARILKEMGLDFEIVASRIPEPEPKPSEAPHDYTIRTARHKAYEVGRHIQHADPCILAADTIVVLDNKILGKPESKTHATQMLSALQNRVHLVMTGFVLYQPKTKSFYEETVQTKVWFRKMSQTHIEEYIATNEPMDKSGSYAIQGKGRCFVRKIEGCFYNVVGLPISHIYEALEQKQHSNDLQHHDKRHT